MEFKEQEKTNRIKAAQKNHMENKNPESDESETEEEETEVWNHQ